MTARACETCNELAAGYVAGWVAAWATEWRWQEAVRASDAYARGLIAVSQRPPAVDRMRLHYEGWMWGACDVSNRAHGASVAEAGA